MEYLHGGRENKIIRFNDTVQRPAGFWSESVHALLTYVRKQGFLGVPEPLGFDHDGNEILSYLPGEVSNYPLSTAVSSTKALTSAATLLCSYHDSTVSFLADSKKSHTWLLPTREPTEVICHGDFAPYNVVLDGNTAVAIIDFDTAHPAPRAWDIAYALYRWAPLTNPTNPDGFGGLADKIKRAALFCESYGLPPVERVGLVALIIQRLRALVSFMITEAEAGNAAFQANIADGHHLIYLADVDYLHEHRDQIEVGIITEKQFVDLNSSVDTPLPGATI